MFVKFQCGCIGIPAGADALPVIVQACDDDGNGPADSLMWWRRDHMGAPVAAVTPEKEAALHAQLARRLGFADRFDAIRVALDVAPDGGQR